MSDDKPPSTSQSTGVGIGSSNTNNKSSKNGAAEKKSWFTRLIDFFQEPPQDREELIEVLKNAEQNTLINPELLSMMEGVMHISELHARDIMVARPQMVVVNDEMSFGEMLASIVESGHSRFPVIGDNRDDIEGIILAKDLLHFTAQNAQGQNLKFDIKDFLRPAAIIPESKRLDTLLKEFRTNRNHMAMVVDEYGSVAGLVTIEDVLEQIVGDIEDEFDIDGEEETIQKMADNEFVVKGHTEVDEFNEYFDSKLDEEEFDTIGGILMQAFGHVPAKDESIMVEGFKFEIINADTRKVKLVRVFKQQ
ncbi:MAG: CBS domain-containing protein [Kangiellaceae bacterium]|nr:CBS domain-containing protein [Kangiellaceae bacterium]